MNLFFSHKFMTYQAIAYRSMACVKFGIIFANVLREREREREREKSASYVYYAREG
jgi:hypothetical protein